MGVIDIIIKTVQWNDISLIQHHFPNVKENKFDLVNFFFKTYNFDKLNERINNNSTSTGQKTVFLVLKKLLRRNIKQ